MKDLDTASHAARHGALVVRESARSVLSVRGSDRATWLNGVVTCDIAAVVPGRAAFGLLLSKLGKIQTDFYALATDASLLLACAEGTREGARSDLERMLVMEDAELAQPSEELVCLALHGPGASELVSKAGEQAGVVVGALDRSGLGGVVLLVPRDGESALLTGLQAAGAVLATDAAWQALRVERRIGSFGLDYGPADNPHEAGLERLAISWNKGCYLGQEVVFMQDARGKLKRRLVQLGLEGALPIPGTSVTTPEGDSVGEITSASQSSVLNAPLALARVKAPHFEPGARLVVGEGRALVRGEPV